MYSARNITERGIEQDEGFRFISEDDFVNEHRRTRVSAGDVLLTIVGTIGRSHVVRGSELPFALQRSVAVLRAKSDLDPTYLKFWLDAPHVQRFLSSRARGTAQKGVYLNVLREVPVRFPPREEQRSIVAALETHFSRLDAAVASLHRAKANVERARASVLQAAVTGRLVPTEAALARAEGRDYEPASALLARILVERKATSAASGARPKRKAPVTGARDSLQELPEGWCRASWSQIGLSQNGRAFPSSEYCATGIPLLRPGNLHQSGRIEWTARNTARLPYRWAEDHPAHVVRGGELVMNLTAQSLKDDFLGRACVTGAGEVCLLNQRIARLTPICLSPRFLLVVFKSRPFRRFVESLNKGSLIQHMFTSQLESFDLPLPPEAEQHRIVAEVDRRLSVLDALDATLDANLARCARLRQAILQRAFSGRLVPAEPTVPAEATALS
jgi:type I restriction enzyme S subunit